MERDETLIREDIISIFRDGFIVKKVKYETYADGTQYYREIYPDYDTDRQEMKRNGSKDAETRE